MQGLESGRGHLYWALTVEEEFTSRFRQGRKAIPAEGTAEVRDHGAGGVESALTWMEHSGDVGRKRWPGREPAGS